MFSSSGRSLLLSLTLLFLSLAWSQVGGHSVIPKSVTPSRIQDNFKEIELTAEEVAKVSTLGKDRRRYNTPYVASKWPALSTHHLAKAISVLTP